jgi:hypothetical protein
VNAEIAGIRAFLYLGAFFAPQKTGLSACIFFASGKKGYRFYPLRGPKPQIFLLGSRFS